MKTMTFYPAGFAIIVTRRLCGASMASPCKSRRLAVKVLLDRGRYAKTGRRPIFAGITAAEEPVQKWEST